MEPTTMLALATALGPLLSGLFGGGGNSSRNQATTQTSDLNLQRMLQLQAGRLEGSEPLYRAVMDMAMGLLPTQYQRSGSVTSRINLPAGYGGGPGAGRGAYTPNFSDGSGGMGGGEVMSDGREARGDNDFLQRLI